MKVSASKAASSNGEPVGGAVDQLDPILEPRCRHAPPTGLEHLGALVEPDHATARSAGELDRDGGGPGRHVEHGVVRPHRNAGNKEPAPARILAEGEQSRVPVVGRSERCKELHGVHVGRV